MHKIFKRFLASTLLACFPLVFSACGVGSEGGGENVEMTTISGTAVKGPIKGALVRVYKLKSDGTKGELLGYGASDGNASYSIQIPKVKAVAPLLVTVSGQSGATYKSETTNNEVPFTSAESFNAALDTFDSTKKYTVSPLTDAAFQQVQKFLTDSPSSVADARVISAANARVATLFSVSDILADPAADPAYVATLKIIDQMVVNSGAANTLQTMTLINNAFVDVQSKPYQNYQAALTSAATTVIIKDPAVAPVVNTIVATVATPPAEPIWTDITPPKAIINLTAIPGAETAIISSVTLSWSPATTAGKNPVAGYAVYRDGKKIASVALVRYVDKPLTLATTYTYYVIAFDAAGNNAPPSAEITVTTPSAPNLSITVGGQLSSGLTSLPFKDITPPAVPSNLTALTTAIDATTSSVKLSWNAATDNVAVAGYDVYRDGQKIGTTSQVSYTDVGAKSGIANSYTAIAYDAAGNRSAVSVAFSVTPVVLNLNINVGGQISPDTTALPFKDITPPSTPSNIAASTTAINATTSSVKLTWSASTDNVVVSGYDVYRDGTKINQDPVKLTAFTDSLAKSGFVNSYSVIAFDAAGNRSSTSAPLSITPVAPNLSITVGGQLSSSIAGL